jgi:hypothetical protein
MDNKIWVVVEYVMWEYCCIVGIFETEQEAIDLQASGINNNEGDIEDYFLARFEVPFGEVSAKALVRSGR